MQLIILIRGVFNGKYSERYSISFHSTEAEGKESSDFFFYFFFLLSSCSSRQPIQMRPSNYSKHSQ